MNTRLGNISAVSVILAPMDLEGYVTIPASQLDRARTDISRWLGLDQISGAYPEDADLERLIHVTLNRGSPANPNDTWLSSETKDSSHTIRFQCSSNPDPQRAHELLCCLTQIAGATGSITTQHNRYVLYQGRVVACRGETVYFGDPDTYRADDLTHLAQLDDPQVLEMVAANPNCPPAILNRLASHSETLIIRQVASNYSTPASTLSRIVNTEQQEPDIRQRVAGNPATSPADLVQLLQDPDQLVVRTASENPSTPRHALAMWQLANT